MSGYKQWRVMVIHDDSMFMRDRLKMFIGYRDNEGFHVLEPFNLEGTFIPDDEENTTREVPPHTHLPTELAEEMYRVLGMHILKTDDPLKEIVSLRGQLARVTKQLEDLIRGIGALGGNKEGS